MAEQLIQPVYDTLKYLAITSSTLPSEAFWMTRVFYTRRHRNSQTATPSTSSHLSPIYQLLVGFAISQAGGTIINVVCNRKVTWIADDSLYFVALVCWYAKIMKRKHKSSEWWKRKAKAKSDTSKWKLKKDKKKIYTKARSEKLYANRFCRSAVYFTAFNKIYESKALQVC